ncbi:hypothetical protein NW767_010228 [Fusarium falciforme]|nr:hypothetical protein NW767_010228 [Fusarium falciforme]
MEVLGAVASGIAVVQALEAVRKTVGLIREIPEIQGDFDGLIKELDLTEAMAKVAQQIPSNSPEQDFLAKATEQVNEVTTELNKVLESCARGTDEADKKLWKTKKRKWLLEEQRILKLERKLQNAKGTLHLAMTSHGISSEAEFRARFQMFMDLFMLESRTKALEIQAELPGPQPAEELPPSYALTSEPEELDDDRVEDLDSDSDYLGEKSIGLVPTHARGIVHPPGSKKDEYSTPWTYNSSVQLRSAMPARRMTYTHTCQCRCHFKESSYQSAPWTRPLVGSWLFRSNDSKQCTNPNCCRQKRSPRLQFQYQVPTWFFSGALSFQAAYSQFSGLNWSLRPFTLIEFTHDIWGDLRAGIHITQKTLTKAPFYPNDHDVSGEGLMEYAIRRRLYNGVEALLCQWASVLPESGLPRNVLYEANAALQHQFLTDHEIYILNKVKSFVKDQPETTTTQVHTAVRQGWGLKHALEEEPWAIDTFDSTGSTPLHLAARMNRTRDAEMLVNAGADVDIKAYHGRTALMFAANCGDVDTVKVILKAGCNPNITENDGAAALHFAVRRHYPEMVAQLLAAGADAMGCDERNSTPLHHLAQGSACTFDDLAKVIDMLLLAKADLEFPDDLGFTPLLDALMYDQVSGLRCLINAGASLSVTDYDSRNILHFAAEFSSLPALELLNELDLPNLNPYRCNEGGYTPWDCFVWISHAPYWLDIGSKRLPSYEEQSSFMRLYGGIRDRNLRDDIETLEKVLGFLKARDGPMARARLVPLIKKEEEWERENYVAWAKAVDKRIQHEEWQLAMDDVEDYLKDLREELATPVWETPSKYGYLYDDEVVSSEEEEEDEEKDDAVEVDYSDDEKSTASEEQASDAESDVEEIPRLMDGISISVR